MHFELSEVSVIAAPECHPKSRVATAVDAFLFLDRNEEVKVWFEMWQM
jgi:hypothetical protein